jgi:hypothetical protein
MFTQNIKDFVLKVIYIIVWILLLAVLPVRLAFWLAGK